ncbi:hypothetical protein D3C76_1425360 [compost metagenome]
MLAKTKKDPSRPGIKVHQRTWCTSSLNPATPFLISRIETNSTMPTSELSSMAIRMVLEVWVMRTISVFCTTRPMPAATRNTRVRD